MASSNEYLQFILDQLSELDEITYRAMMGEYIICLLLGSHTLRGGDVAAAVGDAADLVDLA